MVAIPPSLLGSLAAYPSTHLTPHIGTEFTSPNTQLSALLAAPNSDELIRDLAVLISHRGVVFFRAPQDDLSIDEQKHITDMLGKLTGRPAENGLHVHPLYNDPNNIPMANGETDQHMYVIILRKPHAIVYSIVNA